MPFPIDNPNEYDDEAFLAADLKLHDAVAALFNAGASEDDVDNSVENAKENV